MRFIVSFLLEFLSPKTMAYFSRRYPSPAVVALIPQHRDRVTIKAQIITDIICYDPSPRLGRKE